MLRPFKRALKRLCEFVYRFVSSYSLTKPVVEEVDSMGQGVKEDLQGNDLSLRQTSVKASVTSGVQMADNAFQQKKA